MVVNYKLYVCTKFKISKSMLGLVYWYKCILKIASSWKVYNKRIKKKTEKTLSHPTRVVGCNDVLHYF